MDLRGCFLALEIHPMRVELGRETLIFTMIRAWGDDPGYT
ncbi:hypothetical protein NITHO_3420006 [Nitrolancea hollandica Lb]|uniref:Uncharacterized protein n=1 Tax=Nitrolancea hollandica Lb TaxID=1129897 RepID=I4EIE3_9BACT|nr:hypothetical protein NITHO_3420006 [Nitrolancea hollandica Lb]